MSAARARIDGRELELVPGETLLAAAARLGIEIPTVCHLPGRPPDGGCRVCLVEVEGASRPLAACHTPARDGMDVRTATPALERLRASVREVADAGRPSGPREVGHPYLRFDPSLCVTCRPFTESRASATVPLASCEALSAVSLEPSPLILLAVMSPAAKLPEPSRFTRVFAVLASVAALAAVTPLATLAAVWPPTAATTVAL